jgi:DNA-binding response OmpR family regulator
MKNSKPKTKLLIVDDMPIIRECLQFYFEQKGFTVFTSASAEEALRVINKESPDIMLSDINLPQTSGIELIKLVRQFNREIKVMVLTGCDIDFRKDPQLKALNILAFLHKPIDFSELEAAINKVSR